MSEPRDLSSYSLRELFRMETETQAAVLTEGLLALERDPRHAETLESLMRAAHSIKGSARIVQLDEAVRVAHHMEDCFSAAQRGELSLQSSHVDALLEGVDTLTRIAETEEAETDQWISRHQSEIDGLMDAFSSMLQSRAAGGAESAPARPAPEAPVAATVVVKEEVEQGEEDRLLRIGRQQIDRLLGLAAEVQVQWQWLDPHITSLRQLKRQQMQLEGVLAQAEQFLGDQDAHEKSRRWVREAQATATDCRDKLAERLAELEAHGRSLADVSQRLYHQSVASRMQPLADGIQGLKRMVRDLARDLGKQVRLEIVGSETLVDRDILEKIKPSLNHLLRNAVDHGIEAPAERCRLGKQPEAVIRLEAGHRAGMLNVTVADDGAGIDLDALRQSVVARGLAAAEMVERMGKSELTAFLFLPKFTLSESVSEISGRGVGLDVVASTVREVRGRVNTASMPGKGTRFELQLPVTLSVLRALLVEIAGEPYAFPLVHVERAMKFRLDDIEMIEGRQYVTVDDVHIGLIAAGEVLALPASPGAQELSVVILAEENSRYGLIVDDLLGERDLVEQALDTRLGKVKDIAAGALMPDGAPLLVFDVADLIRSIDKRIPAGKLGKVGHSIIGAQERAVKRILVVDDSLTVREVERKLLVAKGYEVEVAVDGMDGWNSVRAGAFDLVIIDVDMPRMDGIELVHHIRGDPKLKDLPAVIVSYKESDEDRMRGLEAGADYYLTKSSFHDEALLDVVGDLIGEPQA